MLIVDDNLLELVNDKNIINNKKRYDKTCLTLSLSKVIKKYSINGTEKTIIYGEDNLKRKTKRIVINKKDGYKLKPKECILACSNEWIEMPNFCFGLLQTKGSLARLFVSINCTDGQIDPGYKGKITFEICNFSDYNIILKPEQLVGNLYIFKTSMNSSDYQGKYIGAEEPTVSM